MESEPVKQHLTTPDQVEAARMIQKRARGMVTRKRVTIAKAKGELPGQRRGKHAEVLMRVFVYKHILVCIYIYIHTYIHTHTHIHTYIHTYIHACITVRFFSSL